MQPYLLSQPALQCLVCTDKFNAQIAQHTAKLRVTAASHVSAVDPKYGVLIAVGYDRAT